MARGPRRRRGAPDPGATRADDDADLGAPEHAWWAQRDVEITPRREDPHPAPAPEVRQGGGEPRDILAEHFGSDWRTSFGFDHPGPVVPTPKHGSEPEQEPVVEPEERIDTSDPYAVLGVASSASWEEIVDAHRALARRHHPDRLAGRPTAEIEAAEQRIRDINVAYHELRVRRGK